MDLPTEDEEQFLWEGDQEVTKEMKEETGVDSDQLLRGRSFKIVARR